MKKTFRPVHALAIAVLCGIIGWWLGGQSAPKQKEGLVQKPAAPIPANVQPGLRLPAPIARDEFRDGTTVEIFASSETDEAILRFPTQDSYEAFLFAIGGSNLRLVDQLDRLRAIRLGYEDWSDLADLLAGENIAAYDALPIVPGPSPGGARAQDGLVGFGGGLLAWLGIQGDNSRWGAGVKVAVLDTGVLPHTDLPGLSKSIAITPFPEDLALTNGHGTAVASLIAGKNPVAPGIAPAVEIISIRVGDDAGRADSFSLAAGILAAIDSGAQIINISMGTSENNPLIEEAVLLAHESDVLIVAASGNSSQADASYPAAYPTVISVGAVDARGGHLEFSNYGNYLSITAPGYGINAAWTGNRHAQISGTSASAPIVTGAIAATMSSGRGPAMTASQAAQVVMKYANEAGIPGPDSEFGFGILDLGRIMNRSVPGIVDAAITDQRFVGDQLQVTVQNRGTSVLVNTMLEITLQSGTRQFNATTLVPGAIHTFSMPVRLSGFASNGPVPVTSQVTLGNPGPDATPDNNRREDTLYPR